MTDLEKARKLMEYFYMMKKQNAPRMEKRTEMSHRDIMFLNVAMHMDKGRELVKMSEISEFFHITPAAVSQMVREYEQKGWVERVVLESDRRSVYVKVTEEAITLIHTCEQKANERIVEFISFLGEEDSDALLRIMEKVVNFGRIM